MDYTLHHGDCLAILPTLEAQSVDAVICDPPYGTTACKWDSVIPFAPMWEAIKRLLKPRGACVLFGAEPFASTLRLSNLDWYRYDWTWIKTRPSAFAQAPYRPLDVTEIITVFSQATSTKNSRLRMKYSPQGTIAVVWKCKDNKGNNAHRPGRKPRGEYIQTQTNYPQNVLRFSSAFGKLHPTEKPLALLEYLVKTYTDEGDTVLDFTMGSGTTGHACMNLRRRFIGIERDAGYYAIAERRIMDAADPLRHMKEAS